MKPYLFSADSLQQETTPTAQDFGALCTSCHASLSADDKAIYMKLVSRTATSFLCIDCLGRKLGCGRKPIEERIRYYRESGNCTLFR